MSDPTHSRKRSDLGWIVAGVLALVVVLLAFGVLGGTRTVERQTSLTVPAPSGLAPVDQASLPSQARDTIALIRRGGPFPYAKDGAVFANREGVLPQRPRGYYHEYTVTTPGSSDRGARRIVTGDHDREFFYTDDHYRSFREVRQ